MLVVWKLDRLGRSLLDLIGLVQQINGRNVGLRVLAGHGAMIDTTRAEGRMMFGLLAVLAAQTHREANQMGEASNQIR